MLDNKYINPNNKIIIAIDGFSGCGKSTLAKDLSAALHYTHIDTGALYRAITLHCIRRGIDPSQRALVTDSLADAQLSLVVKDHKTKTLLNGEDVTDRIKNPDVAASVSDIAKISAVRDHLKALQQSYGIDKGVVMDGRDIGTVIFPHAELKLFIIADIEERSKRRLLEMEEKGVVYTMTEVRANLLKRDKIDSSRKVAPLKRADDAIIIDTTYLSRKDQLNNALTLVKERL